MRLCAALLVSGALLGCSNPTGPEKAVSGEQIYRQYCARCHGPDGAGTADQPAAKDRLSNKIIMKDKSDMQIKGTIMGGKPPTMPGFAGEFTEAKMMVLVAYVRSLSGTVDPSHAPGE